MPSTPSCVWVALNVFATLGFAANDGTVLLQVDGHQPSNELTQLAQPHAQIGFYAAASLLGAQLTSDASHEKRSSVATEEIAELLAKPESVFADITSKVGALEKDLAEMRQRNEQNLASQVKMYKKLLEEQLTNNTALVNANDGIKAEIQSLTAGNAQKRLMANELTRGSQDLVDGLQRMRSQILTTHEFVGRSLESAADADAPELHVLTELDDQDATTRSEQEHKNRLHEVMFAESSEDLLHLRPKERSMLQVGAPSKVGRISKARDPDNGTPAAEGLVKGLGSGLAEFALRAKDGEDQLKARFAATYKVGADRHASLLEEQRALVIKRADLVTLGTRLSAAVAQLQRRRDTLQENTYSVQGFMGHLGKAGEAQ